MAKLTQKQKLIEAFLFANAVKSQAKYLDYLCTDDDYQEGKHEAELLLAKCNEFLNKLK